MAGVFGMELTVMQLVLWGTVLSGICLVAGAFIGIVLAALMTTAKEADKQSERLRKGKNIDPSLWF